MRIPSSSRATVATGNVVVPIVPAAIPGSMDAVRVGIRKQLNGIY